MKTRLASYRGGKLDLMFPIQGARVTIGREADNMVQLPHEKVSKHHAVILPVEGGWEIKDLESTNGVFINDNRVPWAKLADGDRVKIGPFELVFETNVPSDDGTPTHIIDLSSEVHQKTLPKGIQPPE